MMKMVMSTQNVKTILENKSFYYIDVTGQLADNTCKHNSCSWSYYNDSGPSF